MKTRERNGIVCLLLLALAETLSAQTTFQRKVNTTLIQSPSGSIEVEFLSPSTFRFQRCRSAACPSRPGFKDPVALQVSDTATALEFKTEHLLAEFRKSSGTMFVRNTRGKVLLDELPLPPAPLAGIAYDRVSPPDERLYGLGPRTAASLDLRGSKISATTPLLLSSTGYGQFFSSPGAYEFDLAKAAPDRVQVRSILGSRLEYFFYYGPTPKEILEEHLIVAGAISPISTAFAGTLLSHNLPKYATVVPPLRMPDLVHWLNHSAFSGVLAPAADLAAIREPFAYLLPLVYGPQDDRRKAYEPYLYTYLKEARDRGLPMLHPIAMQYPADLETLKHPDTFLIGDEILIGAGPKTYLPQGIWTDLRTNTIYRGRQVIDTPAGDPPAMFCHNGTILPLAIAGGAIQLHYFPRLGAEFFIAEAGEENPTQIHAAPSTEFLRLEIESRVTREYEWVVHHVSAVEKIEPSTPFRYDEKSKTLSFRTKAPAESDIIFNITLKEPLE